MCGITGFLDNRIDNHSADILKSMTDVLRHRGPDDGGIWLDNKSGVGLGHRRLAILDLSPEGHQPMHSPSGRYVIVFNGEIYNFQSIRKELTRVGYVFRGHSDTEVMLAAFEAWGWEKSIPRFVGMFAFALWDKQERILVMARDRLGEKPLYYGWQGKTFLFGSELKSLRKHPSWQGEINRDALSLNMRHNYIPAPYSIYQHIHKLMPGTFTVIKSNSCPGEIPQPIPYWQAKAVAENGIQNSFQGSDIEAVDAFDSILRDTIRDKMISDVPLGAFLSGGIDSSTIVALMQAESKDTVRTFSIGFHEEKYNEAVHAKEVARHLGTEHTELYVTPEQALDVIPLLPGLYDEPFTDSSQIPTYLVSKMTKQNVTVALSGDGGDELFGGYNRYFLVPRIWNKIKYTPLVVRKAVGAIVHSVSPTKWDSIISVLKPLMTSELKKELTGDRLYKLSELLAANCPEKLYHFLVSHCKTPESIVLGSREPLTAFTDQQRWADLPDFIQRMMFLDMISYLPDDILVKVDRAAMGVSLETRVPFLDHRVVEFAWQIPQSMKIRNGEGKWILRQVLYRYVPKDIVDRPKKGFGVPIDLWLRGPLREWAESLLDKKKLDSEGFFDSIPIRQKWQEHLSGDRNWQSYLWDVLMFQAWLEHNN